MKCRPRPVRAVVLACLLALVTAACAGGGETETTGTTAGGPGGTAAPVQRVGGSMEVAAVWTGKEQDAFKQVLAAFSERSGTNVTFTSTGDDIATALRTRIQGNAPPDVAILPQPGLLRDLVRQGAVKPIDDVAGAAVSQHYSKDWRDLATVDGKLHGVFFKGANKSTVWYNVAAFRNAGVQPPKTFDELLTTARTLKDSGVPAFAIGGSDAWTLTDWFENIYVRQAGREKYAALSQHRIPWTDPSVKEALATFARVLDPNLLHGSPVQTTFVQSVDAVFRNPASAAMVFEGDFVPGSATVSAQPGRDYDQFPFPTIRGSAPATVVSGGDVAVMLKDTPQARELMRFLASPQAGAVWARLGGFSSPNKDVDPSSYPNEIARRTARALAEATVLVFDMSDLAPSEFGGTPGRGEWDLLQRFARNPADIDGITTQLEQAAAAAYK